ncbi:MAG: hypothetical protein AAGA48_17940 [Myxococcota bacterium]
MRNRPSILGHLASVLVVGLLAPLASCGSVWDLREGEVLPIGCVEVTTFIDADGDGWGGEGALGQIACVTALPPGAAGNDLDCDDNDPNVTGLVSRACPDSLDPAGNVAGLVVGQREFVAFDGTSAAIHYTTAADRCEGWASEMSETAREGQRGLATLQDSTELQSLPDWLESLPGVGHGFAAFVDLRFDEATEDWRWPDGSVPEGLPLCGNPEPVDFLIDLAPADPMADALLDAIAVNARLALVLRDDGWCYGTPSDGTDFGPQQALAICERPAPNPVDYPTVAP